MWPPTPSPCGPSKPSKPSTIASKDNYVSVSNMHAHDASVVPNPSLSARAPSPLSLTHTHTHAHAGDQEAAQEVGEDCGGHHKDAEALLAKVGGVEEDCEPVGGVCDLKHERVHNEAQDDAHDFAVGLYEQLWQGHEVDKEDCCIHHGLDAHHEPEPESAVNKVV